MKIRNKVLKFLRKQKSGVSILEIAHAVRKIGVNEADLRGVLSSLVSSGKVRESQSGVFTLTSDNSQTSSSRQDLVQGEFLSTRKGFGFVRQESGDLFIPLRKVNGALHKDIVIARKIRSRRQSEHMNEEGEIIQILTRKRTTIVGYLLKQPTVSYVVPTDKRIPNYISVDPKSVSEIDDRTIVIVEITSYGDEHSAMKGKVIEVLGSAEETGTAIEAIIHEHGIRQKFPKEVLDECENLPSEINEKTLKDRSDYRNIFTVTIDGKDAKDFDDAVSCSRNEEDGTFTVHVHIADVSHFVPLTSSAGEEALARGTSVYLVDRVIPMFPERLSNDLASLRPNEDRLTFSVEMTVDTDGEVREYLISESVIHSDHRLTYDDVDDWLVSENYPNKQLEQLLKDLKDISDILAHKRLRRGGLMFETIEPRVIIDADNQPIGIDIRKKTPATTIIEELMILTNETVAEFMSKKKHLSVYRVHDKPDMYDLAKIEELAVELRFPHEGLGRGNTKAIQKLINYAHDRDERYIINSLLLRAMKKAVYSSELNPHFGLASKEYSHFTSPIRRFPDFILHHLIKMALGVYSSDAMPRLQKELPGICDLNSSQEREAEGAERDSRNLMIIEYMEQFIGDEFVAIISGVVEFGFFVELENSAEGLVRAQTLTEDYYIFKPAGFCLIGRRSGKVFRLGEKVRVKLTNADVAERQMDFQYLEHVPRV